MAKLSILIPVFNEKATLPEILRRVQAVSLPLEKEIIIVDDGSSDGTTEIMRRVDDPSIQRYYHTQNQGKGAAVRTALEHASGDFVLIQDADLEYDPKDYVPLLEPLLDGRADVVYGSRFLAGPHRVLMFWHYMANRFITLVANVMYDVNLTDMGTCYKAFAAAHARTLNLRSPGFGLEAEITAKVCKKRLRIYEIPISYSGRTYAEGKKITPRAALVYLWCLLRFRFSD